MTARTALADGACTECLRRSWLLAELGAVLDCNCRADGRLLELLELDDSALMAALGGRRRATLEQHHAGFRSSPASSSSGRRRVRHAQWDPADVATVCRHDARYPRRALAARGLGALHVLGGCERLRTLTGEPVVAFVGRASASDYGVAVAASLARGLAAAGVIVASGLTGGIGPAALDGALELGAPTLGVIAGGLDTGAPARRRVLRERLTRAGCAVAELPCGSPRRRSTVLAGERLLAALADVALVVESEQSPNALAGARAASSLGRTVAAVPGRIGSPGARGPHALLREGGARLVTRVGDVLDMLCDADRHSRAPRERERSSPYDGLDPSLRAVLEQVGAGADTPGRLLDQGQDADELLRALGELELMGLLVRGDGGRYVQRDPLAESALRYRVRGQMEP